MTASPADILTHVAEIGGLQVDELVGPGHTHLASLLRRAAIELLRSNAGLPFTQIAQIFGRSRQWAYFLTASADGADRDLELRRVLVEARRRLDPGRRLWRSHAYNEQPSGRQGSRRWLPSLAAYRQAAGLSVKQLAVRTGLPRETVSRLERLIGGHAREPLKLWRSRSVFRSTVLSRCHHS